MIVNDELTRTVVNEWIKVLQVDTEEWKYHEFEDVIEKKDKVTIAEIRRMIKEKESFEFSQTQISIDLEIIKKFLDNNRQKFQSKKAYLVNASKEKLLEILQYNEESTVRFLFETNNSIIFGVVEL